MTYERNPKSSTKNEFTITIREKKVGGKGVRERSGQYIIRR